jgi:hypothetical protein
MAKDDPQFRIRLPEDLRSEIIEQAEKNGRSINAEIVARLRNSLGWDKYDPAKMSEDIEMLKRQYERLLRDLRFQFPAEPDDPINDD